MICKYYVLLNYFFFKKLHITKVDYNFLYDLARTKYAHYQERYLVLEQKSPLNGYQMIHFCGQRADYCIFSPCIIQQY